MENTLETWKKIDGFNYSVSDMGRVRNDKTQKILKAGMVCGYHQVVLCNGGKRVNFKIHRLVAIAFVPNIDDKKCVDHVDNDILNNTVGNLRWATDQENNRNCRLSSKNKTGVKGVCYDKKYSKFRAHIRIDGIAINLGRFNTLEEAKDARVKKANEVFGVFVNACERLEI
jgi:hypothetical protein